MYKQIDRRKVRAFRKMRFWKRRQKQLTKVRLCVFRSAKHVQAQIVDDASGKTIATASSMEKSMRSQALKGVEMAARVGQLTAERALAQDVKEVIFDRNGFNYHGRVKAFADAAREAGLKF